MKVLHITAWYPSVADPSGAPFVHRHVLALEPFADQRVWHVSVQMGRSWRFDSRKGPAHRSLRTSGPFPAWRILEAFATTLILFAWFTRNRNFDPDVVNFAIAHPNCVHLGLLHFFIHKPFVITEHYSAYHYNFNNAPRGLNRIRNIFKRNVPIISVSRSLINDIQRFAGIELRRSFVVHNVCNVELFKHRAERAPVEGSFFALAYWRRPKRPDLLIEAIGILARNGRDVQLRIGGNGEQLADLVPRIEALGIKDRVLFLGDLSQEQVAEEMNRAHLFLHASDYETYGVVCAEALCSGTPVIASHVGGIPEYLDNERGRTVQHQSAERWANAILNYWDRSLEMDRSLLSRRSQAVNSASTVGASYASILQQVIEKRNSNAADT